MRAFQKQLIRSLFFLLGLFLASSSPWADSEGRQAFEGICLSCHPHDMFEIQLDRSFKSWELTVFRMQGYADFSDEDAATIIHYLSSGGLKRDMESLSQPPVVPEVEELPPESVPEEIQEEEISADQPVLRIVEPVSTVPVSTFKDLWDPGMKSLFLAKQLGYVSVAFILLLIISGVLRKWLKKRFRIIHRFGAVGLVVCVSIHAIIDLFEYGTPGVLWYWFGLFSTLFLFAGVLSGAIRKAFPKVFLWVHGGVAVSGLVLALLHWVWVYL